MKTLAKLLPMAALVATCFGQAASKPALPKDLPPAGPMKAVVAPTVHAQTLKNGMTIWLVQRTALPKVVLSLQLRGGDSLDPATAPGLAKLMAKAVVEGTSSKSSRQIAEAAQGVGGDLGATADSDSVQITLDSLSEHAADAVALVADVAQHATFPDGEVAQAKSNMQNELRSNEAQPGFLARRAWFRIVYGDHPYGTVAPSMKALEDATQESLRALYAKAFRPDQAQLVAVGNFEPEQMLKQIEAAFGGWPSSGAAAAAVKEPKGDVVHKVYYLERPGSVQTTLIIGTTGPDLRDPDYPYLRLANTVYGGSFGSRLIQNIREDKGYTYSPFSRVSTRRYSGEILTSEDVRNAVTGASLKETFYELKRISTAPPTAAELSQAKQYLLGNTAIRLQSRGSVAGLLGKYWIDDVPAQHLTEEMAAIQKASDAEVAKAGAKYLVPERMNVIAVGEKAVILDQLKPFGMDVVAAPAQ
jgi:predicted Zn-dependent peptidase